MLVDDTFDPQLGGSCYRLAQVHHLCGHTLRVHVYRDTYQRQSHATIAILTPNLTWTGLTDAAAADWWPDTGPTPNREPLAAVADHLVERAHAILARPHVPGSPGTQRANPHDPPATCQPGGPTTTPRL